ncbi:MAG: aspartoacylase [Synechococcaceae cyanobacterium]|nr:aspartoacylase [Synechococcaceae cyanobacterium]
MAHDRGDDSIPGRGGRVLVVAGTHGNERNAPWLLQGWQHQAVRLDGAGLAVEMVLGNPAAFAANQRYIDRDLNRSFVADRLADPGCREQEADLARALLARHGPSGEQPCLVALDLHSTTAAMGNCLVLYGRRPADLGLAAAIQERLGLPMYLHEGVPSQTGHLAECWPAGLAIEVGPVAQGVVQAAIVHQTRLALEAALASLAAARRGTLQLRMPLQVHRHLASLDLPRGADGCPVAVIHPSRQNRDWQPITPGEPLFLTEDGSSIAYTPPAELPGGPVWPLFINEAAYGEKGIALSLTRRESWQPQRSWREALVRLAAQLEAA